MGFCVKPVAPFSRSDPAGEPAGVDEPLRLALLVDKVILSEEAPPERPPGRAIALAAAAGDDVFPGAAARAGDAARPRELIAQRATRKRRRVWASLVKRRPRRRRPHPHGHEVSLLRREVLQRPERQITAPRRTGQFMEITGRTRDSFS